MLSMYKIDMTEGGQKIVFYDGAKLSYVFLPVIKELIDKRLFLYTL